VQDGDWISLDCGKGELNLDLSAEEISRRLMLRADKQTPEAGSGYQQLYIDHVLQADQGCDFDFLLGNRGRAVPKHSH